MKRNDIPEYPAKNTETLKPGLYLGLFHGRKAPNEELDDWGFGGPVIGPLEYVHTTYSNEVKIKFVDAADFRRYFPDLPPISGYIAGPNYGIQKGPVAYQKMTDEQMAPFIESGVVNQVLYADETELGIDGDMVVFDGEWYGDWTVYVIGNILPTAAQIAKEMK